LTCFLNSESLGGLRVFDILIHASDLNANYTKRHI